MKPSHADRPGMALGLDRESARRADEDVIDVAAAEAGVMDDAPARKAFQQAAHVLLGAGAAVAALDQRQHVARDAEHARQQRELGADEAHVVQAEGAAQRAGSDRQDAQRHERAQAQPLHHRARVLSGRAARRIAHRVHHRIDRPQGQVRLSPSAAG